MADIVELPTHEGIPEFSTFLKEFEEKVSKPQRLLALEESLKATLPRWWVTHKKTITGWAQCRWLMTVRFGDKKMYQTRKYDG